ncbi:MAG: AAA family ATPase [Deltaproteobacteria bacterium]|nr:AAA family ATPase [Deltaproteobacteria bacterium]
MYAAAGEQIDAAAEALASVNAALGDLEREKLSPPAPPTDVSELVAELRRWRPEDLTACPAASPLRVLTLRELLTLELPTREHLLAPWLSRQGLAMIYAQRGVGKTFFALNVAYAVATGSSFLRFRAPQPRRVLIIDGEMPAVVLQQRLARIAASACNEPPNDDYLRLLPADVQSEALPDLATGAGQKRIEPYLDDVELLILDNISTLCRTGVENEAEGWAAVQAWALALRRRGISALFLHHAGKNGAQRGTSKREDVLDTVIVLRRPSDYDPRQGARFEVHFDKTRGLIGDDAAPFEAMLEVDAGGRDVWTVASLDAKEVERVATMQHAGLSQRDIAKELNISLGKVNRLSKLGRGEASNGARDFVS